MLCVKHYPEHTAWPFCRSLRCCTAARNAPELLFASLGMSILYRIRQDSLVVSHQIEPCMMMQPELQNEKPDRMWIDLEMSTEQ